MYKLFSIILSIIILCLMIGVVSSNTELESITTTTTTTLRDPFIVGPFDTDLKKYESMEVSLFSETASILIYKYDVPTSPWRDLSTFTPTLADNTDLSIKWDRVELVADEKKLDAKNLVVSFEDTTNHKPRVVAIPEETVYKLMNTRDTFPYINGEPANHLKKDGYIFIYVPHFSWSDIEFYYGTGASCVTLTPAEGARSVITQNTCLNSSKKWWTINATGYSNGEGAIQIDASDIFLYCNGSGINGTKDDAPPDWRYGIHTNGRSNVTVDSCNVRNYHRGINFDGDMDSSRIIDSNVSDCSQRAVWAKGKDGLARDQWNILDNVQTWHTSGSSNSKCGLYFLRHWDASNIIAGELGDTACSDSLISFEESGVENINITNADLNMRGAYAAVQVHEWSDAAGKIWMEDISINLSGSSANKYCFLVDGNISVSNSECFVSGATQPNNMIATYEDDAPQYLAEFFNTTFTNDETTDILGAYGKQVNLKFYNSTFNESSFNFVEDDAYSEVYYSIISNVTISGSPAENAQVNMTDDDGTILHSEDTNADGYTIAYQMFALRINKTDTQNFDYNLTATKTGYYLTQNRTDWIRDNGIQYVNLELDEIPQKANATLTSPDDNRVEGVSYPWNFNATLEALEGYVHNATFLLYRDTNPTPYYWNTQTFDDSETTVYVNKTWTSALADTWHWTYLVCSTDDIRCYTPPNRTFTSADLTPYVKALAYPINQTITDNPLDFILQFGNMTDQLYNASFYIWNSSGDLYTSSGETYAPGYGMHDVGIAGDTYQHGEYEVNFTDVTLAYDSYQWNGYVCDWDFDCSSQYHVNNTFTVSNLSEYMMDTQGNCFTEFGYYYNHTSGDNNYYTLVNLTQVSSYLTDVNSSNIWIEGADAFLYSDYHLVIDTVFDKSFSVWIGGSNINYNYSLLNPSIDEQINPSFTDFTLGGNFYEVNMLWEEDGTTWDYNAIENQTLTAICNSYAPDTLDLKNLGWTSFYLSTKEKPKLIFESESANKTIRRVYQPYLSAETISIYNLNGSSEIEEIDYELEDWTVTYGDSYLQIFRNVDGTLKRIWQEQWYDLQINDVSVENDSYLQYVVYKNGNSVIITWDKIIDSGSQIIVVSEPVVNDYLGSYEGLTVGFTFDHDSGQVGVTVECDEDITTIFNVSNASSSLYVNTYSGQSDSDNVTFTYTLPNKDIPVYLEVEIDHPRYGKVSFNQLTLLYNESNPIGGIFNPILPGEILGSATTLLKALFGLGIVIMLFYVGCKASNYGVGTLAGFGAFAIFWWTNIFPKNQIPFFMVGFFGLLAFVIAIGERRGT